MLGRQDARPPRPQQPRGVPEQRDVRVGRPLPVDAPGEDPAAVLRSHLGHEGVQQPGRLADGRVAAVRVELRRRDGLRQPRRLRVRVEGGRAPAGHGHRLLHHVPAAQAPEHLGRKPVHRQGYGQRGHRRLVGRAARWHAG